MIERFHENTKNNKKTKIEQKIIKKVTVQTFFWLVGPTDR